MQKASTEKLNITMFNTYSRVVIVNFVAKCFPAGKNKTVNTFLLSLWFAFLNMTNGVLFTELKSLCHTTLQQKSLHPSTPQLSLGECSGFFWQPDVAVANLKLQERVTKCRKIRLIEGNAKCRHLKTFTCKGTLRQVFIWPRTLYPPPPTHTLYTGGGERELNQREEDRGNREEYRPDHTAGLKIPTWVNVGKKLAISSL